jgi:hypothetical protein
MNTKPLEPLLRDATIKAIDGVAKKLGSAERSAESKVAQLLTYWNEMELKEKEEAVGIAIATVTTAVMAIAAFRGKSKKPLKSAGRKLVRAVGRRSGDPAAIARSPGSGVTLPVREYLSIDAVLELLQEETDREASGGPVWTGDSVCCCARARSRSETSFIPKRPCSGATNAVGRADRCRPCRPAGGLLVGSSCGAE